MSEVTFLPPTFPPGAFSPILGGGTNYPRGTPMRASVTESEMLPAQANDAPATYVFGLLYEDTVAGNRGAIQPSGLFILPTDEWDALTGDAGGLVAGDPYYVSAATPGKLTKTAPVAAGSYVAPVGYALNPTTLKLISSFPVGPHA